MAASHGTGQRQRHFATISWEQAEDLPQQHRGGAVERARWGDEENALEEQGVRREYATTTAPATQRGPNQGREGRPWHAATRWNERGETRPRPQPRHGATPAGAAWRTATPIGLRLPGDQYRHDARLRNRTTSRAFYVAQDAATSSGATPSVATQGDARTQQRKEVVEEETTLPTTTAPTLPPLGSQFLTQPTFPLTAQEGLKDVKAAMAVISQQKDTQPTPLAMRVLSEERRRLEEVAANMPQNVLISIQEFQKRLSQATSRAEITLDKRDRAQEKLDEAEQEAERAAVAHRTALRVLAWARDDLQLLVQDAEEGLLEPTIRQRPRAFSRPRAIKDVETSEGNS